MGLLQKVGAQTYFLKTESTNYKIVPENFEVLQQMKRLNSGDLLIGQGEMSMTEKSVSVFSIDYVGLTHILGVWLGENMIVKFKNFNEFSVYEFDSKSTEKYKFSIWNYSLAPLENNNWALFFSDETSTNLGRLELKKNTATLDILNVETGEIIKSTSLKKPLH